MGGLLRALGACLLVLACGGAGVLLALRQKRQWESVHVFNQLLDYLRTGILYRAQAGEELIEDAAAWPDFAALGLGGCQKLRDIPPPTGFGSALQREIADCLAGVEDAPREAGCAALAQLLTLCRAAEEEQRRALREAVRLYPKLGLCAGLMAAIVLI